MEGWSDRLITPQEWDYKRDFMKDVRLGTDPELLANKD